MTHDSGSRASRIQTIFTHVPGARRWASVPGLALVAALAALDATWGENRVIIATVVIAPFVTALLGSARQTAAVATTAVAVAAASGLWNDNLGRDDYLLRLLAVIAGAVIAVSSARSREQLSRDRVRFRLLRGAAEISDTAAPVAETIQRLSDLLVPELADVCVMDVVRDGQVERLAVAAHGPRAAAIREGLLRRSGTAPPDAQTAMRSGEAHLIADADDTLIRAAARDEGDLRFLRSLEGRSSVIVPLRARGRSIGSMALIVTALSGRRYGADDLEFAKVLSGRVALALDNAGLFSEVERLEAQRSTALGELAEAVTMQNATGELVYANEAAARALGFASAEELLATPQAQLADTFDSFTEDGAPLRLEDLPGRRVLAGETPEPLLVRALNRRTGEERWRVLKASGVPGPDGRPQLAVTVMDDVTEVKRAELAQRLLAQAGEVLASSLDYEETLAQVARLAVPQLADWCAVTMPDEHGHLRSVAVAHVDPARVRFAREYSERYPTRASDPGGVAQVIRTGESQMVNEIPSELLEQAISDPEQLAALRSLGMRAVMLVPMATPTGVIGAITFVSAESGRTFIAADLELAEELGRRAATAVENARLYTERSRIARTLQASLLPDELPAIPAFEVASLYRPAGTESFVGGDFYDAFETPAGWMLLVGDVTGRGPEAAALTAQARHTLRTAGTLLGEPLRAIEQLNRSLCQKRELSICTVAVVLLSTADGETTATVTCAGHPAPLLVRGGRAVEVGSAGPIVGAWRDSAWATETFALAPGDVLVLYTDGVTDAQGEQGRFGDERLKATVAGAADAHGVVGAVRSALEAFERGARADDTAVVAVQRLPTAAPGASDDPDDDAVPDVAPVPR
jgi:PAS domain S-box-containing protein